ncbi:uncharacterized protein [Amphiura filiformis]|uniref:uncharacterized protein n=1 Tax=Amphiura filiformis TaxID=82378 RepID=UPI003B21D496
MHTGERRKKWSQKPKNKNIRKAGQVKVMVLNFQSVNNKVAELAICLDSHQPDVLIGTESWLSAGVSNSEIFPPDYSVIRKDRPPNVKGQSHGGIFIAVKNDLIFSHRADLDVDCEILWIQLELVNTKNILIGAFYRPPDSGSDVLDLMQQSLSKIDLSKGPQIWLAGDFNLSHIEWDSQSTLPGCQKPGLCRQLIEISNDFGLDQVVKYPTRGDNILELFFTTNSSLVEKTRVLPGMSDHNGIPLITIDTKPKTNKTKPRRVFQFFKADWSSIKHDLAEISSDFCDIVPDLVSANELWMDFKNRIQETTEKNVPSRLVSGGKKLPWVDHKVKNALRHKHKAYNKARASNSTEDWEIFRSLRKHVNRLTRSKYRSYIRDVCAESNKNFGL